MEREMLNAVWIVSGLFIAGYVAITLEHQIKAQKAPIAMIMAVLMWGVIALGFGYNADELTHHLELAGAETFGIILFLLLAMTLVEILVHYGLFDWIRAKLYKLGLSDKGQFVAIGVLTFFLSAVLDNLTVTIVMVQIALRFFKGRNLLVVTAGIVIFANAGGAWSPIGDVTTIMLWIAGKYSASQIIMDTFLASLVHLIVTMSILYRQIKGSTDDSTEEVGEVVFTASELTVIFCSVASFILPLLATRLGLQPFMGLLFGLSFVWILIGIFKVSSGHHTHLDLDIEELFAKVDLASLLFFVGILFAVSALNAVGVLELLSQVLLGMTPSFERIVMGNVALGYLSAVVDNVPLTALAIDMLKVTDARIWTLLAYTVGTGGSHLIIGSVAGVVAMGMVEELTSAEYFKIATKAVAVGYIAGVIVWYIQTWIIG